MDEAHLRLGHLHEGGIKRLLREGLLGDLIIDPMHVLNPCIACLTGKARKGTPPTSTTVTSSIGDLLHMDICGPIQPPTISGNRSILTATDGHSHFLHTWALKTKGAAFETIQTFLRKFENQQGTVKKIRTDNGIREESAKDGQSGLEKAATLLPSLIFLHKCQ